MSAMTEPREGVPIASVEQSTGIARATLRIWERRYGFPQPGRDPRGERSYPGEQVQKLRLIADLMAQGHRPGRLVQLTLPQLVSLAGSNGERGGPQRPLSIDDPVVAALRRHDAPAVVRLLEDAVRERGLAGFVADQMARLNVDVGLAWARGEIEVFEEHLYTEAVQNVLRHALATLPAALVQRAARPRILLTTLPHEAHSLGLLMAEAMFAIEGAHCLSLGVQTPVQEIAAAARMHGSDAVALSLSASLNPNRALEGLRDLAALLPDGVALWAGGGNPALKRAALEVPGLEVLGLVEVADTVGRWRARHSA